MSTDDDDVEHALEGMQGATGAPGVREADFDDVRGGADMVGVVTDEALDEMQGGSSGAGITQARLRMSADGDND